MTMRLLIDGATSMENGTKPQLSFIHRQLTSL